MCFVLTILLLDIPCRTLLARVVVVWACFCWGAAVGYWARLGDFMGHYHVIGYGGCGGRDSGGGDALSGGLLQVVVCLH